MEKFSYIDVAYDNNLNWFDSGISPDFVDIAIEDPKKITAIRFVFKTSEGEINKELESKLVEKGFDSEISKLISTHDKKFKSKLYFIGKIVAYDEVKDLIDADKKSEKYAVSYDENGSVKDTRPIDGVEEVIPVNNTKELENVYSQITGKAISITTNQSKRI